ncbi:unnamed protein product (macronuclear) [Paramecium tetraurelia]|uniref:RING-type domain-containing protein n=1 Tax=Paramecium tetraurelia TaxID=5888 RepID=A0CSD2_PARTE|nr:uncharacterized protein GSPATT00009971001 [Paramecium tetraurelia]CAK73699.1 unnamed protein product [Paramecium tetraurelia]|eukprot:XP_001441096.1 hypothetical protein (macronuclear) [Paramecium tetraurelia strain d4-2]
MQQSEPLKLDENDDQEFINLQNTHQTGEESQNKLKSNLLKLQKIYQECKCPSCQLLFEEPITIVCGHTFCRECIIRSVNLKPQCPECLYPITNIINNIQENFLVKSVVKEINELFIAQQQKKVKPRLFDQIIAKRIQENIIKQYLIFETNSLIIPYTIQNVKLHINQFKDLNEDQIYKILKRDSLILLTYPNKNQSIQETATLVIVIKAVINSKMIDLNVHVQQQMRVLQIKQETSHIEKEITLNIAKVQEIKEEPIIFNFQTDQQIKYLIDTVSQQLAYHLPENIDSYTNKYLKDFFHKLQLFEILRSNILRNEKALKHISYVIPSILHLTDQERTRIFNSNNSIERLIQITKILERFQYITNPLMVFKIPGDKERINYQAEFLIIIVLLILAFYYRVIGF